MLQFVPGLGPVRARHIAKKVVQAPLVTRTVRRRTGQENNTVNLRYIFVFV